MEDKVFRLAIIFSFLVHLAFFVRFHFKKSETERLSPDNAVTCTLVDAATRKMSSADIAVRKMESMTPADAVIKAAVPKNMTQSEAFFKENVGGADNFKMFERQPERLKGVKMSREVFVPVLKSEKINTPSYVSYYQAVRDRIRERAYDNYTKMSVGEVYLTFIIRSDGSLGELQIIDDKSTANDFLRDVGRKSIKEAAPFPVFPSDLKYPELTFNIAISFQYREE